MPVTKRNAGLALVPGLYIVTVAIAGAGNVRHTGTPTYNGENPEFTSGDGVPFTSPVTCAL
jgi:TRAP-type mannitol/chloroaromatic compound transport system substrate-binding protein